MAGCRCSAPCGWSRARKSPALAPFAARDVLTRLTPFQQPFRDAGYARADFHLSLQDVIFGTRRAIDNRLLKLDEFNLQEYEHYEKVENGDWNFLTPHFLAFASPVEQGYEPSSRAATGPPAHLPKINKAFRNVLDYFEKNNVRTVVRLNKKLYNERRFTERGMEHKESESVVCAALLEIRTLT